jgi:hypothetical protein
VLGAPLELPEDVDDPLTPALYIPLRYEHRELPPRHARLSGAPLPRHA